MILHDEGRGEGIQIPHKNYIICTTVLRASLKSVWKCFFDQNCTVYQAIWCGMLIQVNIGCTLIIFDSSSVSAVGAHSPVLVWLEMAVIGVKLTPWTKGEIISLCLTKTESQAIKKGVAVLRHQIVNQK